MPNQMLHNVNSFIFPAAFALLPGSMDTHKARAMILAIGLQESEFAARRQVKGPAHGLWQFEKNGGTKEVLEHPSTRVYALLVCHELLYKADHVVIYDALPDNDILACCWARLLLWTVNGMLPDRGMPERGWRQYIDGWRPGRPHRETWNDNFAKAWTVVEP